MRQPRELGPRPAMSKQARLRDIGILCLCDECCARQPHRLGLRRMRNDEAGRARYVKPDGVPRTR